MPESIPSALTKRDVLIGRQCRKALWLDRHRPDLREPPTEAALLRMEQGNAVDRLAREVYAGGIEILEADWELACRTTRLQIEAGAKRLYQAAFEYEGMRIRTDILDLLPDGSCELREVKMSTQPKPEHRVDAAVQVFVLEANGCPVRTANLVLIDTKYSAGSQAPVFYEVDITEEVRPLVPEMEADISAFGTVLSSEDVPPIRIGSQCTRPSKCSFYDHCWKEIPKDSLFTIPRLSESKASQLLDLKVVRVIDVPDDFTLTDNQREYVQLHKSGVVNIDRDRMKEMLLPLSKPLYFLDFETHSTPLPSWTGTRPYQQVPFQFSCHLLDHDDTLKHRGYLHRSNEDPRPTLIEELLGWIGREGTIMVYNAGFERRILQDLAEGFPEYAERIHGLVERIFDQLDIVKAHIRHPGLLGSNSLKAVTEVLLPSEITYKGLEVADGESAQAAWNRMIQLPEEELEKRHLAEALERYCLQDTLGQVALHRWCLEG